MLTDLKQSRFEHLSSEYYQVSHTFHQGLWAFQRAWGGITHFCSGVQKQDFGGSLTATWGCWKRCE